MLASEDSDSIAAEIAKFASISATDAELETMLYQMLMEVFNIKERVASAPPVAAQVSMERRAGFVAGD